MATPPAKSYPPVDTPTPQLTDFLVMDYGQFVRDNANFDGLLRLIRSSKGTQAELYIPKLGLDAEDGSVTETGEPIQFAVVSKTLVARIGLKATGPNSSVYEIVSVENIDTNRSHNLIIVPGGTIDFGAVISGFDLGSNQVIDIKIDPNQSGRYQVQYAEAQIPPKNICEQYLVP
jgi:hypothetical protein